MRLKTQFPPRIWIYTLDANNTVPFTQGCAYNFTPNSDWVFFTALFSTQTGEPIDRLSRNRGHGFPLIHCFLGGNAVAFGMTIWKLRKSRRNTNLHILHALIHTWVKDRTYLFRESNLMKILIIDGESVRPHNLDAPPSMLYVVPRVAKQISVFIQA